jgi:sulfoxide reductase heme-binding subunit YedZ
MKKIVLNIVLLLPVFYTLFEIFILEIINEPVKYIYTISGVVATCILFFTIVISLIKKRINLIKYRKTIGLYGFFYACIHLINFVVFDAFFDIAFIIEETLDKPFIYLGMIAFLILLFMALTSTKRLFKKYLSYHRLIYLALLLITIHFIMAQKTIDLDDFCYILIILVISYYKLLQQIMQNNKL